MRDKRKLLIILAGAVICFIAARLAVSVTDRGRTYEVEPWITMPEYRTDAGRAIDAYERLMERYMDLAESQLVDCRPVLQKLDSIDTRMDDISKRLARIEKAMGIDPNTNLLPSKASIAK